MPRRRRSERSSASELPASHSSTMYGAQRPFGDVVAPKSMERTMFNDSWESV